VTHEQLSPDGRWRWDGAQWVANDPAPAPPSYPSPPPGFWARVLTGPTLSPLGWTAQNLIAPRLGERKPVPGPPKRFAQGIGAVISTAALVLGLVLGHHHVADGLLIVLAVAAGLESIFAICLGCHMFALLMRAGLVPREVCAECADLRLGGATRTRRRSNPSKAPRPV